MVRQKLIDNIIMVHTCVYFKWSTMLHIDKYPSYATDGMKKIFTHYNVA